jgi:bifunctional enzyme CysN/CysC
VQYVLRSPDARRYAGELASGILRKGDPVRVLPSGQPTSIQSIHVGDHEIDAASPPLSISVTLAHELDISRGDMLVDPASPPAISRRFAATLVWMDHQPLETGRPYLLKHTTRTVCASVARIRSVIDPATLQREPADRLLLNQFGEVEIETHQPLYFDPYSQNRVTGAFVVIDPIANGTLGAGMIASGAAEAPYALDSNVPVASGAGLTVWFTGLSSAGKSTISQAVHEKLWAMGHKVELLDGDVVRQHLNRGLGFSKEDRDENVRRIGFVAELLTRNGVIVLVSAISPYRSIRDEIRQKIGSFLEVYVHAPLEVCEQRDLKGIYRRARAGEMRGVTGVDDPYEPPFAADVECHTDRETPAESAARVLQAVLARLTGKAPDK